MSPCRTQTTPPSCASAASRRRSRVTQPLVLISQVHRSGGTLLSRLFEVIRTAGRRSTSGQTSSGTSRAGSSGPRRVCTSASRRSPSEPDAPCDSFGSGQLALPPMREDQKLTIDTAAGVISTEGNGGAKTVSLYSTEGFELISDLWLKVGWNQKQVYTFSWLGRPIIQMPEDMIRIQEVIHELQPDVIIETGVAHGGSLIYYASLAKLFGRGRVVGIDIEIRPHNRTAIEEHPLSDAITLIEGSSTDPATLEQVAAQIEPGERTLVMLDSNHTREHVRAELEAYHELVSVGSYLIVMDGIMQLVADTPRARPEWSEDNPISAVEEFVRDHPNFVVEQPEWPFNESELRTNITHWPFGYLRRVS